MAAITVGFVAAVLALAQVIVLVFVTLEGQRGEITALVGAITKGLLAAQSTHTEKILFAFFQGQFDGFVVRDSWSAHYLSCLAGTNRRQDNMISWCARVIMPE
jgi:hypothetical protein